MPSASPRIVIRRLHLRGTNYGTERAQRMTPWLGPVESFGRPVSGDGGIISTVEDVATFSRSLLGGNLLAPKQLAEMTDRYDGSVAHGPALELHNTQEASF